MVKTLPKEPQVLKPSLLMRKLFVSEACCVSNLIQIKWNAEIHSTLTVLTESTEESPTPAKRPFFNRDFIIDFVDWRNVGSERLAAVCSVLPNALGAELFLIVDKNTLVPTALELSGGGAFPIEYYASYIECVKAVTQSAMESLGKEHANLRWKELLQLASMRTAAFVRLLVVGGHITFLCFATETAPVMRGQRCNLVKHSDREIDYYVDGDSVICLDGWIRMESISEVPASLVAIPQTNS